MAASFSAFVFTIFICVFLVFQASGQTNETVTNTGSSSSCICDLVVNGCDPNCCCDTDCTSSDKESFSECQESRNVIFDDRVCVSDQVIFIKNIPFKTENTGDGLFCIYHNNNKDQEQYSDVGSITNDGDFTNIVNSKNLYFYNTGQNTKNSPLQGNYKVGDKILLLLSNQTRGYLSLPTTFHSSSCNDMNAAAYFQDDVTECVRSFVDFPAQCSNLPTLSAKSYLTGFEVAKTPEFFLKTNISVYPGTNGYNVSLLFKPTLSAPLLCKDSNGVLNQCSFASPPDPTYNMSTKTCENVVAQVSYNLVYSNESTNLERLAVSLVFESVQGNFLQKYSIRFLKEGTTKTFTKSGNPGYLVDQAILAGLLQTHSATNKKAIHLSTNRNKWLTIPKTSLDGLCSSSIHDHRLSVTFNINTRSGCMIRLNRSSDCSLLQVIAFSALLGSNPPDYVASFGNSDVKNAADWVKIINEKPGNSASGSQGVCENMVLGMHIEILFAKIGYLANPQAKIVGVRFKYDETKTISYQCIGQFCQDSHSSLSQSFEVVSSVSFIDVSEPPSPDHKAFPEFQSKAPSDFFHPFL